MFEQRRGAGHPPHRGDRRQTCHGSEHGCGKTEAFVTYRGKRALEQRHKLAAQILLDGTPFIKADALNLRVVQIYKHLGSKSTVTGVVEPEVTQHTAEANKMCNILSRPVFDSKQLKKDTKIMVATSLVHTRFFVNLDVAVPPEGNNLRKLR